MADGEITFAQAATNWGRLHRSMTAFAKNQAKTIPGRAATASRTKYMRDAIRDKRRRRRKDDTGPLRIVSGRLLRALTARKAPYSSNRWPQLEAVGVDEAYRKITVTSSLMTVSVDLEFGPVTDYARVHEEGHTNAQRRIKARPYFFPGVKVGMKKWRKVTVSKLHVHVLGKLWGSLQTTSTSS